jgi:uncharacterized repeat protein (TIGR01451 family)
LVGLLVAGACALLPASEAAVLRTITVDGDMSDWVDVLADPYQTSIDGPRDGLIDLDAPVPSTGRDLTAFAWTYDANFFYLYVERVGSSSNRQIFWFYMDTDEDGLMQTGEPLVRVSWWGRSRLTDVSLNRYVAVDPAGDPLGDPSGIADGWVMPGSFTPTGWEASLRGGAPNGFEMESAVPWSALGIAPGTPIRFHVSSSNSDNIPSQAHDNMGGPGGVVGSTRFSGVLIQPKDITGTVVPAGHAWLPHSVANTGEDPDRFDLTWTSTGDFAPTSVDFWHDVDGDGRVGPSDALLADTDGNGFPDTGLLSPSGAIDVIAVVSAPSGIVEGESALVEIAATSPASSASDATSDTVVVAIPAITLVKTVDRANALPGDSLTYTVTYTSTGSVDAHQVVLVDPIPSPTIYESGSATGSNAVIEFSHDGGVSFDASEAAPVTHIRWRFPSPFSPGTTGTVSFRVSVP